MSAPIDDVQALPEGLFWYGDDQPGLTRHRVGRGWSYRDPDGHPINDPETIDRISAMAIPAVWTHVWISPQPGGHLLASGRDVNFRKHHIYNPVWLAHQDAGVFDRMADFVIKVPLLWARIDHDLKLRGQTKTKVLATALRLMELGLNRISRPEEARRGSSEGLKSLYEQQLETDGLPVTFILRTKQGNDYHVDVRDRRLAGMVQTLDGLPGQHLFSYLDTDGVVQPVLSDDLNAYVQETMGQVFAPKDYRSWAATLLASRTLLTMEPPVSSTEAKRKYATVVKTVAGKLGISPATCRTAYIHPRVFELFQSRGLHKALMDATARTYDYKLLVALTGG